jgi:hypothetical protein
MMMGPVAGVAVGDITMVVTVEDMAEVMAVTADHYAASSNELPGNLN